MSQIQKDDVRKLAELAMLELSEEEITAQANSINSILGYVSMVANVNLEGISSTINFSNITKEDVADEKVGSHSLIMQNVRQVSKDGFVEVSKVINK